MTSIKYKNGFDELDIASLKNCNLCSHQAVCVAFSLFKQSIQPNLLEECLKAEDLAKICKLYEEKGLR
jgi:hypothetical protein